MVIERGEISEVDIKVEETHILEMSGDHGKEDWMDMCVCVCVYVFICLCMLNICVYIHPIPFPIYIFNIYKHIFNTHYMYIKHTIYIYKMYVCIRSLFFLCCNETP